MLNKIRKFNSRDWNSFPGVEKGTDEKPSLILEKKYFAREIVIILSPDIDHEGEFIMTVWGAAPESEDHFYLYPCSYEIGLILLNGFTVASHSEIFLAFERNFMKLG